MSSRSKTDFHTSLCAGVGTEPGRLVWRMEMMIPKPVIPEEHGRFYNEDTYVVLVTKNVGNSLKHVIFFWLGEKSEADGQSTAAIMSSQLDEYLGGTTTQHREVSSP